MSRATAELPHSTEAALLRAIEMIYEAATDPAYWPVVLEALARKTQSELANLVVHDVRASARSHLWWYNMDPAFIAEDETWAPKNPFIAASASRIRTGFVCNSEDILPSSQAMRTEYFNEYLRRIGVLSHIGACIVRESDMGSFLFLPRRLGRPGPARRDLEFISALMPHLGRAMAIHRRLDGLAVASDAARELLDRVPFGIVLLDRRGCAVLLNRSAEGRCSSRATGSASPPTVGSRRTVPICRRRSRGWSGRRAAPRWARERRPAAPCSCDARRASGRSLF